MRGRGACELRANEGTTAMRLTERDQRLIRWANGHGYVSVSQVGEFLGNDFSTAARRVRALCDAALLERRQFPMSALSVLIPSQCACDVVGDDLAPIGGIRVGTSRHDLLVVDCASALERRFEARFVPERRLRSRLADRDHLPDGILHRLGSPPIAVELELTAKAPRRLQAILDSYASFSEAPEVWYIVVDATIERHLRRFAEGRSYVRVINWKSAKAESRPSARTAR